MTAMSEEDRKQAAVNARKEGNKALVAGDAQAAFEAYSEGLRHMPEDHLLLGNRSEALLVMERSEEALADAAACVEQSEGRWSKGFLRKANAEVALGQTREAIHTLRAGMRALAPTDSKEPWLDKLASVKDLHFKVRVEDNEKMGRVLVANQPFTPGAEVMSELPVLMWDAVKIGVEKDPTPGDKPVTFVSPAPPQASKQSYKDAGAEEGVEAPQGEVQVEQPALEAVVESAHSSLVEKMSKICESCQVHPAYAAHLENFLALGEEEQDIVLKCCCPTLPMSRVAINLVRASAALSNLPQLKGLGQMKIVKLMIINKVNTHRMLGNKSGLYEVASKMAHSCTPNTLYDGTHRRFIAIKNIPRDALVTFSYNSSQYMVHSSEVRQTILRQAFLFVCKCERCVGVDHTRGIACKCGKGSAGIDTDEAIRYRTGTRLIDNERGLTDVKAWSCNACGGTWSDEDMSAELEREEKLEREVHDLESEIDTTVKYQYERLKQCVERALQYLSRNHWCYIRLCCLLAHYHYHLARRSPSFASDLLQLAVLWGKKYSAGLVRTKVAEHVPMMYVEWGYWLSLVCGDWPHLLQEKVTLLEGTYPTYSTIYPDDKETQRISAILAESQKRVKSFRNKAYLGKSYKQLKYDYDESELFDMWENLLADQYMDQVRSNPNSGFEHLLKEGHMDPNTTTSS